MPRPSIVRYLNPWKHRREKEAERLAVLRSRDGDACARCRRPMRFDLPAGHDQRAAVEEIVPGDPRLCHTRCNPSGIDHTGLVTTRARQKNEAALFARARESRAA